MSLNIMSEIEPQHFKVLFCHRCECSVFTICYLVPTTTIAWWEE